MSDSSNSDIEIPLTTISHEKIESGEAENVIRKSLTHPRCKSLIANARELSLQLTLPFSAFDEDEDGCYNHDALDDPGYSISVVVKSIFIPTKIKTPETDFDKMAELAAQALDIWVYMDPWREGRFLFSNKNIQNG